MAFFYNFQTINYFNKDARNIIAKAALIPEVFNNLDSFYPYVIREYERPDLIAFREYGDESLDWVIYFSNNITDPFFDWPLDPENFKSHLEKKYNKSIYELQSQISHYKYTGITDESQENIDRKSWFMSKETHELTDDTSGWSPVYLYDYEQELNDAKRSIMLLNSIYIPQLKKEIKKIFNNEQL
jgi:hypothetical protein